MVKETPAIIQVTPRGAREGECKSPRAQHQAAVLHLYPGTTLHNDNPPQLSYRQ